MNKQKFEQDYNDYKDKLSETLTEDEVNLMMYAYCMGYCSLSTHLNEELGSWVQIDPVLDKIKELGAVVNKLFTKSNLNNKTLHLNLKRKWFEMILKGDKKEEYRDFSNYWIDRLTSPYPNDPKRRSLKQYDTITFSNGYAKDRDQFVIEFKGMKISTGNPLWGAKPLKEYFCIQLGNIISKSIK